MAEYLIVQISDIHLTASGLLSPPGVRPRDNLLHGLDVLEGAGIRPDVIILTGDLADAGEPACYRDLATIFADVAERSGVSVIFVPGNHDDRGALRRSLPTGAGGGPVNQTHWRDGLRIIALDSTVPGEDHGYLDDETVRYLRDELAIPASDGTVVALHHPPIPSPIRTMSEIALREPGRLREAIAGSDVRIVLCGHNHHAALGTLGAVPVWVSPATAYQLDTTSTQVLRGIPGAAFSRVDLSGGAVTVTPIPIPAVPA